MKGFVGSVLLAAVLSIAQQGLAQARDFTVTAWGGAVQDAKRNIYFTPFGMEKGIKVLDDVYEGGWAPFKAMQDTGVVPWDVVQVETAELVRGCEEGIFAPLDWSKIGDKKDFVPYAVSQCGVGTTAWSIVIAYNKDSVKEGPATVQDFFNLQKWPGKRAMRRGPKINLEFALMADGVAPADVYKVLSTPQGIDRAFAKLDTIKPQIQWWKAGAQPTEWLASGDVALALAYNGRVSAALDEGKHFGIVWQNTQYDVDAWAIPAKSPYIELAHQFIKYASDPKRQADFTNIFAYGTTINGADKFIKPERITLLPAGDNLKTGLHIGSEEARAFWLDHLEELNERFNSWSGTSE
ncbi:ABC transporter substrate-binding protein [Mesorhizobium loti]|uniref:ABC transporter substrate-binding protein n=1 Tax=Rhizobium loti TaxID=381 RepID=UPI0004046EB4|nr:ABC transporter substrate-binding protein [Mesorhizobium loti]